MTTTLEHFFHQALATWYRETRMCSSVRAMRDHPAMRGIVALGEDAVPLILAELAVRPSHLFIALQEITGATVNLAEEDMGRVDKIVLAWLEWGVTVWAKEHQVLHETPPFDILPDLQLIYVLAEWAYSTTEGRAAAEVLGILKRIAGNTGTDLREALAAQQHEIWSHWMRYLFDCCGETAPVFNSLSEAPGPRLSVIPYDKEERWTRQMNTPYADLSPAEQASDLDQADKILAVLRGEK